MTNLNIFGLNISLTKFLIIIFFIVSIVNYISCPSRNTLLPEQELSHKNVEHMEEIKCKLYYANWCGHCQNFKPVWNKIIDKYKNNSKITIETIDCDANKEICDAKQIKGFPTIQLEKGNKIIEYNGSRTESSVSEFIEKNL